MAFSAGNTVSWSDVQTLYNNLNAAKTHIGQSTVSVPGNPGFTVPSTVTNLKNAIESCKSNGYVGNTALTGITVPSSGALLYPDIFNKMNNTIAAIKNTCLHNGADFSGNHGFGSFSCHGFGSFSMDMFDSKQGSSYSHNSF